MSAGLTETDHLAYTGATPWHGLGTEVPEGITVDEMLVAAKLNWRIKLGQLGYDAIIRQDGAGPTATNERVERRTASHQVMYRTDTGEELDVVGPEYVPTQNVEALEFFREYLAAGDMVLSTAGSLWGGRYVWCLADLRNGFTLPGDDEVTGRLLVANPNKYGKGLIVKFVAERVVCHNTLTVALNETGRQITVPHTREFHAEARADAKRKLGLATQALGNLRVEAETFAAHHLPAPGVERVLAATFRYHLDPDGRPLGVSRAAKRVRDLYEGKGMGADLPSARETAWGLLNAVTQFIDHERGRDQDTRVRNAFFGTGETTKNRARAALWKEVRG